MKIFSALLIGICMYCVMSGSVNAVDQAFSKSIYRLDNQRYERFSNESGAVFLLSTSFSYEDKLKSAICESATKTMKEVLKIKDEALSDDDKKNEAAIRGLMSTCGSRQSSDNEVTGKKKEGVEVKVTPTKPDGTTAEPGVSVKKNWP